MAAKAIAFARAHLIAPIAVFPFVITDSALRSVKNTGIVLLQIMEKLKGVTPERVQNPENR